MDKELIKHLMDNIDRLKVNNHNNHTRDWSKGYIKGALFILDKILIYYQEGKNVKKSTAN